MGISKPSRDGLDNLGRGKGGVGGGECAKVTPSLLRWACRPGVGNGGWGSVRLSA
jgi:hypothetical protein